MNRIAIVRIAGGSAIAQELQANWVRELQASGQFSVDALALSASGATTERGPGQPAYDAVLGIGISSVHRLLEVPSKRIGVLLVPGDLAIDGRAAQYIENKIPVIATSHYQKQTLVESFGYSANHVRVVVPGVAPALSIPKQPGLRFVIDASAAGRQQLADYVEIIKALEAVGAHYIWIGAPGPAKVSKQACVGSFEPGPSLDVRALYASADVLISLSESGGATRALEMMQLGGTVIAYDHDSSQEYLAHGYNGYSVARNDVRSVVRYAKHMFANPAVVARMQRGASATASSWCTWFDQRAAMTQAVDALLASMERHAIDVVHTQAPSPTTVSCTDLATLLKK
jgi:glycosyltransferase involved in cell wall biosynthesis